MKPKRIPKQGRQIDPAIAIAVKSNVVKSIYDTIKVRDGRSIGDLSLDELKALADANRRELRLINKLIKSRNANGDSSA